MARLVLTIEKFQLKEYFPIHIHYMSTYESLREYQLVCFLRTAIDYINLVSGDFNAKICK